MMMNLFSVFDPVTSSFLSLNWLSMSMFFMLIPMMFWIIPSRYFMVWETITSFIFKEFKSLIQYSFSNIILFYSLFAYILINNFMGLFPYIFTCSSHMSFSVSISLSMWVGIMMYSLVNFFNETMAHLTPMGTPSILMPFMVVIESISLVIRPLTLAVRLSANMIAGHLLLSLLGSTGSKISFIITMMIMIMGQILLFILEMSVAIIQAYVFSILSVLYSSEC
nr:TPA_asm: ATP synthase F0 subunit 6 [Pseudomyrmex ferrugineus]